ncbi:tetratricopeptide repeat-containing sensor histidine kinase [Jiulongibacter sp. NS-SX5]|uniref:tetratricopeptide repeat-containing sensor histidine kinase n=1 Tax=Jiulongibacter sp. NS-SX5 TaxID=3463854 RepID=UPI0040587E3F
MKACRYFIWVILGSAISSDLSAETGYSRDSLRTAISILQTQDQNKNRDSLLSIYHNELIEKLNYGGLPEVDEALGDFEKAQKGFIWPVSEAFLLRAKARINEKKGDYLKAIDQYHRAVELMQNQNYTGEHLAYTYVLLAYCVLNNGDADEAWELFETSTKYSREVEDKSILIWALDFFGDNTLFRAKELSDYEKALDYYKQVEQLLPESKVENQISNNLQGQAKVYELMGNSSKAEEYRQRALNHAQSLDPPNYFNIYQIYTDWARASLKKGQTTKAIDFQQMALKAAKDFGFLEMVNRAIFDLYQLQKETGDTENALLTLEQYMVLEDSLKRTEVNEKYAELSREYEFEKQQKVIKTLENKNLKYSLAVLGVLLLAGGIILWLQAKSKSKIALLNDNLQERNREVEEALYEGKKLERRRVSDQLHDHIATKISALKWQVEAREEELPSAFYSPLVSNLESLYEDVRGLAHELRPLEFLDKGLKVATEELLGSVAAGSQAEFQVEVDDLIMTISKSLQYHLYQFVMELTTNLQKHSSPSRVKLEMKLEANHVLLHFENDGLLSTGPLKEGQGLRNIRNKVSEYGGDIEFQKTDRFTVQIAIPLV